MPRQRREARHQLDPQRWNGSHARDFELLETAADVRQEVRALQHQRTADVHRGEKLVEPVVEAEGQDAEQPVRTREPEILRHDARARDQIAVRRQDSLRQPGGTRRVEDDGRLGERIFRGSAFDDGGIDGLPLREHDGHAGVGGGIEPGEPALRSHQYTALAVTDDVRNLLALQPLVDRHDDGAETPHRVQRRDLLDRLVEEEGDLVACADAGLTQGGGGARDEPGQFAEGDRAPALEQRRRLRPQARRPEECLIDPGGGVCHDAPQVRATSTTPDAIRTTPAQRIRLTVSPIQVAATMVVKIRPRPIIGYR